MDLSIIIIGYNTSKELQNCLLSINNQKNIQENIEIIYIDDGSIDNSIELFNSFKSNFPKKCIKHKKNKGRNIARNSGIKNSLGRWCFFINSNIILKENVIHNYLNEIKNTTSIAITGNIEYTCKNKKFESYLNNPNRGVNSFKSKKIIPYYFLLFSNACIKKSTFNENLLDSDFIGYGGSEMEMSFRINQFMPNSILFIPNVPVIRLNHPVLKKHLSRLEEFGENNIFFLLKKINIKNLPNTYKIFTIFLNKSSLIFSPLFYLIRLFLLIIISLIPNYYSNTIIKYILGLSIIIGISKNKHI